jgi:hypothetical protein
MFKKASQLKLRIATSRGMLSVEQLWDLSKEEIGKIATEVHKTIDDANRADELGFLRREKPAEQTTEELTFAILKDIYLTKQEEEDKAHRRAKARENNRRILEHIARKQDQELEGKSIEELEAMLEEE